MKLKKIISCLSILAICTAPMNAFAGGERISKYTAELNGCTVNIELSDGLIMDGQDGNYIINEGIVSYSGNPVNLDIPAELGLTPATEVSFFSYAENSLRPVYIVKDAFKNCDSLKTLVLNGTTVATGAFVDCKNLETVTLNNGKEVEKRTGSSSGEKVLKPDLPNLGDAAFSNCPKLTKIILNSNMDAKKGSTRFYSSIFENCPIETIVLPEKYDNYVKPQPKYNENGNRVWSTRTENTYVMPDMRNFTKLKNINIPYGTYVLPSFEGCSSLEKIEIPETVEFLSGFKDCVSLKEVRISGNETHISGNTFENCPDVTVICDPSSVTAEACKKYGVHAVDFNGNEITGSTSASEPAPAAPSTNTDTISVLLNGSALSFTQPPVIENGTTLVPMRAIFEAMGASVDWDGAAQTVTSVKGDTTVSLTLNKTTASVNGKEISLAVPAKLINGSTMVPLRFVSESLGAEVNWDGGSKTVTIKG